MARTLTCWRVRLDVPPDAAARLAATLTDDERSRSARLRSERDRQRFVIAHGALREILGRYLDAPPGGIRFTYNAFGKPDLATDAGSRLRFNLAHSGDLALVAVAPDAAVGVDVERVRALPNHAEIARCFFTAEEAERLQRLPGDLQTNAFFECWTRKEAYAKARGEGIASNQVPPADGWSCSSFEPAPGYVGAVVVAGAFHGPSEFCNFQPQ